MGILNATSTLFTREMLIFKKNLKTNIIRSVMFPLIFILILGSIGNTPKNVPIAVVNYDNSPSSISFINQLEAGSALTVVSTTNQQDAMSMLQSGRVTAVVIIPSGFSSPSVSSPNIFVYTDLSSSASAAIATSVIDSTAAHFNVKLPGSPQSSGLTVTTNAAYGATSNTQSFTVAGILIMVATFGAVFGGGVTLLTDRELGNLKAFMITPINKFAILLSKVLYGTVQSVFSAYVALVIGLLYGAGVVSGIGGLIEILWFVLLSGFGFSALSIAMAVRTKQVQTFQLVAQTIVMPLSFLGGSLVPTSSLPAFLGPLIAIDPLTYAVNAVRDVMIKGYLPFSVFVADSVILITFSIVMLALSAIMFKGMNE